MSLGDALLAAAALVRRLVLVTQDVDDCDWIDGLTLIDPLDSA
jgi:predicted nucleic acid-binding protein